MCYLHPTVVHDTITGLPHSITQVQIITVHEELLVKDPDAKQDAMTAEHEGSIHRADIVCAFIGEVSQVVASEQPAFGKAFSQTDRSAKPIPSTWDRPPASEVHRAVK